jgi:hypothetical protein
MIMYKDCRILFLALFEILLCFYHIGLSAQKSSGNDSHTLIIYTIPSVVEIDWTSPGSLSYTAEESFLLSEKCDYALGHMFVQLISPLLKEPLYSGMAVKSRKGLERLVLKDKIGMGILGIENEGFLENNKKLIKNTAILLKKNKINALKIKINEKAAIRIIRFIEKFDIADESGNKPSNYYGGVFWPLYENEGAGCSAFAMSILHLAGFSMEELEKWKIDVKIPMDLIGGDLNNGKKVKFQEVKNAERWYEGQGLPNKDFVDFSIFDPSLLYKWINLELSKIIKNEITSNEKKLSVVPTLEMDYSDKQIDENAPIFTSRPEPHIFIDYFFSNRKSAK